MRNRNEKIVFLSGAVLGAITFVLIFGIDVLDFTYIDWIFPQSNTDLTQHYMGWVTYRSSDWHFPLGLMENVLYPDLISVIFTDSIPLFAFFFKLISAILPEQFQYFGLFGILCYILQGGFSACFIYHFTDKKIVSIISSLFFSASLLMTWRMFEHTALAAHWIVIAALYLWICKDQVITGLKSILAWTFLSIIALLTQAYFLPMVWGCMLCSILKQVLQKKYKDGIITILTAGSSTVVLGWAFGLFYGNMPVVGEHLGVFSFNLNGFFNPQGYSRIFPALPTIIMFQYEGLAYLGAGIFLLLIIGIIGLVYLLIKKKIDFKKLTKLKMLTNYLIFSIFILTFLILSISPVVSFGASYFHLTIPDFISRLWGIFRCTGRLIWPIYYLILFGTCIGITKLLSKKYIAEMVLTAALLLQLFDISGLLLRKHELFSPDERIIYTSPLTSSGWEECAEKYSHIIYYPDVDLLYTNNKIIGYDIQVYAHEHSMSLNYIYFSRNLSSTINDTVYHTFEQMTQDNLDPDTMYIFLDEVPMDEYGLHYYYLDDILIGTPEPLDSETEVNLTFIESEEPL